MHISICMGQLDVHIERTSDEEFGEIKTRERQKSELIILTFKNYLIYFIKGLR